jgi:hypothetical protein
VSGIIVYFHKAYEFFHFFYKFKLPSNAVVIFLQALIGLSLQLRSSLYAWLDKPPQKAGDDAGRPDCFSLAPLERVVMAQIGTGHISWST